MSFALILSRDHDGRRLDRALRSIWPEVPLSAIMRALRRGEVRVDAVRVREPGLRVSEGQSIHVPWEEPGARPIVSRRGLRVPVLWRGAGAMMVNKPAGLLVQPDSAGGDSVITRVWGMLQDEGLEDPFAGGFGPAAAHRLDRNTTGMLAVALRGDSLRALERLFRERRVGKRYLAIVVGSLPGSGAVDAPLEKDAGSNMVRVSREGKTALTRYRRAAGDGELSLASVELLTGRTHQARVHLAYAGCPVLGDRKYGDFDVNRLWRSVRRPLLHAFELSFPGGLDGPLAELSGRTFRARLPDEMRDVALARGWDLSALEGA